MKARYKAWYIGPGLNRLDLICIVISVIIADYFFTNPFYMFIGSAFLYCLSYVIFIQLYFKIKGIK